jgi:hypothetical protein
VTGGNNTADGGAAPARYKHQIREMGAASSRLMALRPVTFRYNSDPE